MTNATTQAPTQSTFTPAPPRKALRKGLPAQGLILITGLPKSGKNTIALSKPGLVLLETEKMGADHLDGWVQETNDIATFRAAFRWALDNPDCTSIGVSTIDKLIGWWQDEICEEYGVASMSAQLEGINLWQVLRKKVEAFVDITKTGGKVVVGLCHFKEPKLDKDGRLVISHNIDAPGKLGSYLCSEADLIGICSKGRVANKMQFRISFEGGGEVGAYGGRVKELEGKTIMLPEENQWAAIEAACVAESVKAEPEKTSAKAAKGGK